MKMQKWNNEKGEYEPYDVPADWQCRLAEEDMNNIVNCAGCGKKMRFLRQGKITAIAM